MAKKKSTSKKSTKTGKTQRAKAATSSKAAQSTTSRTPAAVAPTLPPKDIAEPSTAPVKWAAVSMLVALALIIGYAVVVSQPKESKLQSAKDNRPASLEVNGGSGTAAAGDAAGALQPQPDPKTIGGIPELSAGTSAQALGGAPTTGVQSTSSQLQGSSPTQP